MQTIEVAHNNAQALPLRTRAMNLGNLTSNLSDLQDMVGRRTIV